MLRNSERWRGARTGLREASRAREGGRASFTVSHREHTETRDAAGSPESLMRLDLKVLG